MENFYEHQTAVTGRAKRFGWLLTLTLSGTIITTAFFLSLAFVPVFVHMTGELPTIPIFIFWFGGMVLTVGAVVASASYFKVRELRAGGGAGVAENLGGSLVTEEECRFDAGTRKASHVVAEMAIAAGLPQPAVYLLHGEHGVNAFAVGYSADDAVIGLTQGAVRNLNREQLQGVVAHEFSHIVNGDMRDNMEIIGYLFGVVGIGMVAQNAMQMGWDLAFPPEERRGNVGLGLLLMTTGAVLWVVGMTGLMFSALFKAAISRQREFLADASAVQLTRNPQGLADALRFIGGSRTGSRVGSGRSLEASHLFFAKGVRTLLSAFDSHPPLDHRIRRLDPQWDGKFPAVEAVDELLNPANAGVMNLVGVKPPASPLQEPENPEVTVDAVRNALHVQEPELDYLERVRGSTHELLLGLTGEALGAEVTLLALWLIDAEQNERQQFMAALEDELRLALDSLLPHLAETENVQRLLLFDLASETMRNSRDEEFSMFCAVAKAVLDLPVGDQVFRWAWQRTVSQMLVDRGPAVGTKEAPGRLNDALGPCEVLLSAAAYCGSSGPMANYSFQRAVALVGPFDWVFRDQEECTLDVVTAALAILAKLDYRDRLSLLMACGKAVSADAEINEQEACLLRGISCGLGFPSPKLMPGQPVAPGV